MFSSRRQEWVAFFLNTNDLALDPLSDVQANKLRSPPRFQSCSHHTDTCCFQVKLYEKSSGADASLLNSSTYVKKKFGRLL